MTAAPWVKTSLGPGSLVVTDYLKKAGVLDDLEKLGFYVVGYGCTTCIGNSGPLPDAVSKGIAENDLAVAAVLSGNRNFEGRIHAEVKMNYLASPPLVVAYAIAGTIDIDLTNDPLGHDPQGNPVFLRDIWPSNKEIGDTIAATVGPELFAQNYADVFKGDSRWNQISSPDSELFEWDEASTYIKNPPYFDGMTMKVGSIDDVHGARVLGLFGDSITTDHISPAGNIKKDSPAGRFLQSRGVQPVDFNSYGSRRGNDDVMVRGTFANIRIKNLMFGGEEGGNTLYFGKDGAAGEKLAIYDAAMKYKADGTPLVVFAGKEYGTGSSRDWAAKGTNLLGVKAVVAESFERIHRANLVGMGVLPLQFKQGENAQILGLTGSETFDITGLQDGAAKHASITATRTDGSVLAFEAKVLLLTPKEVEYFRHGGLLHYVLRQLAAKKTAGWPAAAVGSERWLPLRVVKAPFALLHAPARGDGIGLRGIGQESPAAASQHSGETDLGAFTLHLNLQWAGGDADFRIAQELHAQQVVQRSTIRPCIAAEILGHRFYKGPRITGFGRCLHLLHLRAKCLFRQFVLACTKYCAAPQQQDFLKHLPPTASIRFHCFAFSIRDGMLTAWTPTSDMR